MGEARGGGGGEVEVLADAGADALLLALAERPAVEGDDAVGEAAVREPVVQPHPATRVREVGVMSSLASKDGAAAAASASSSQEREIEVEQGRRRRAYASRVCRPSAMASRRAWSCSSSPAAVAAASMIPLRVFLGGGVLLRGSWEEEEWKGDKGKSRQRTVTQSPLE